MNENFTLLIYKKLKGNISDLEMEELSDLLLQNDENLSYFQEISSAWEIQPSASKAEKNAAWLSLKQKLGLEDSELGREAKVVPMKSKAWLRVAAIVLLLVGSFAFFQNYFKADPVQQIVQTEIQKKMKLLPDGSIVWLNKNSKITYPSNFKKDRIVTLDGEAFFEVEKMNGQPFIVQTEHIQVKVLGTKFNVLENANAQEIAVTEGKVEVSNLSNMDEKVILMQNDKVIYNEYNSSALVKIKADKNELFWHTGDIYFNNTPLSEVTKLIEQKFGVAIQISPSIHGCLLTGQYNSAKPEDVLEDLKDIFGFEVNQQQNNWIVEGKTCQ